MNTVLLLLIGICLGIIGHYMYLKHTCKIAGTLNIDTSNEDKDMYVFEVQVPLESLSKYKMILVNIAYNTASDKDV